ncbi:hypothetical protein KXS07_31965 [Inquilinus limosus]|uniref:hypothetical protein n=1 Tax=Inquilinus limosus TaxID=171674 RepID=UPI0006857C26|nr:hypothetical protein [Inquilinus limosus]
MRKQIEELAKLGPMPASDSVDPEQVGKYQRLIQEVQKPISNAEAIVLCRLFGNDDFFGLAWTLMLIIESAPGWPIPTCLSHSDNEWIQLMKRRLLNAAVHPETPN